MLIDILKYLPTAICYYWWTAFLKAVLQSLSALHNRKGTVKWNCSYWKQFSPECLDYSDYLIYKLPLQVIIRMSKNMWKMWATAGIGNQIISHHFKETPPEILLRCYPAQGGNAGNIRCLFSSSVSLLFSSEKLNIKL